ncbi:MAG: chloride channel protein [Thiogranum sp.]|nr:chloride channel protein [Thiogranum sp.]
MREFLSQLVDRYRLSVARHDAVPQLALLGIVAGVLAGLTIVLFRMVVSLLQGLSPQGATEGLYESLAVEQRLLLPIAGGLLIGVLFHFLSPGERRVGILHILERLAWHQGHLPWRNTLVQFIGGAISLSSGHSVGREAPGVHLGAASSNLPAQLLRLPNNSLRVTVACGAAAGIAASFNTPLAGVAFAMEVLMLEYTVAGFAPVILAAVSATVLSRWAFGSALAFGVPSVTPGGLVELPYIMAMGIGIGLLGSVFVLGVARIGRYTRNIPVWVSFTGAGVVVGVCGMLVPQVMGVGDHTITETLHGQYGVKLLLLIVLFKLLATLACIGSGLPGGMIGPSLVIGAAAGALFALLGQWLGITDPGTVPLYALLGMGAMMAAILQAPLAGLIAILELSGTPQVIFPGMLAVVAATVSAGMCTQRESVFQALLRQRGVLYRDDPLTQSLRRIGVTAAMDRAVVVLLHRIVERERAEKELESDPHWILIRESEQPVLLLAAVDLARALKHAPDQQAFDLRELPAQRMETAGIDPQASLQEAHQQISATGAEALYVARSRSPGILHVYGILTPQMIEQAYRY